ncbi:gluconate 2-dehydrogenase subunit 3 family protein [Haloarcula sp. 1CSR25-25]|uniref:gluconate 2-dehydrogenase subunit 3 family protein n=1 Tax=Haloarcula sp. 1CSR25-25 TaxID=2862545 RepID=UPI00289593D7|nr:gluconate 2-dehydrogenase subunit 3 family protein [Haloarcula sp. 1CSR25-25]MDT3434641.1 gluconate 2-dehydrogenase subunit 3 family protein [Haloarcula sp. 1CSR25-25]
MSEQQSESDETVPSRRQFLTALGGTALAAVGYGYGTDAGRSLSGDSATQSSTHPASEYHIDALTAIASAVYPSAVSVDRSFIESRVFGRVEPKPDHFEGVVAGIEAVDDHARARYGGRVTELSAGRRRQVLQSMGVTTVHPTADGTTAEQVRFYVVNDLLYALFTSPIGGELLGVDNPPGHPGGREAYQRGPAGDER